jgi:hypothetical protein
MGISLNGLTPQDTYQALIKIGDNTNATGTNKVLSDGLGNNLPVEVSTTEVNFTGLVKQSGVALPTASDVNAKVTANSSITGATKTKITYDSKGLVTSGADATTADISDSSDKRYVTDAQLVVVGNTSGANTGDNAVNSLYSGLAASKQDALGYTPENVANKSTSVVTDQASDTKYPSVKSVYDWAVALFLAKNSSITGATKAKITYDANGLVTAGADLVLADIPVDARTQSFIIACSDEITAITSGAAKVTFRVPYAFTLTSVRASLTTAQTSGTIFTVDINEGGTSILSTKLTIDNTEKTSTTAATAPVISDSSLADDSEIIIDIDQIGDGTAKGLKVVLIGYKS